MAATLSERLMTPFTTSGRMLVAILTPIAQCCGSADAQDQRRGPFTPSAAGTIHPVAAKHGMVVAQEAAGNQPA
jgi:gamma-glutamyltranspeptidase/glutathione hydrolase